MGFSRKVSLHGRVVVLGKVGEIAACAHGCRVYVRDV